MTDISTESAVLSELQALAQTAREQRLAGDQHHGTDSEFPLVGFCFDNAYVVWHVLTEAGFTARVIEGTTDRVADDYMQSGCDPRQFDSVEELAGLVHYWVEVETSAGELLYIDIASDSFETLGDCLVVPDLPEDYIMLPDSREAGQETCETVQAEGVRCQSCGDHRYEHGGCPVCEDSLSEDLQ